MEGGRNGEDEVGPIIKAALPAANRPVGPGRRPYCSASPNGIYSSVDAPAV